MGILLATRKKLHGANSAAPSFLIQPFLAARLCSKIAQKRPLQARDIPAILGNSSLGLGSSVHLASDQQDDTFAVGSNKKSDMHQWRWNGCREKQRNLIQILEKLLHLLRMTRVAFSTP